MVRSVEKNGLYIFTFIEVLLIFALYFISIENKHNEHTFLIILSVLGINFLVYVIAYCLTSRKIEKKMHDYLDEIPEKGIEMSFLIVLRDPKYFGLFIPSLIIIGASSAIYFILIKIYTIEQKIQYLEAFLNIYWLCDALARVFWGLNSFLFTKIFPKFFFGIFGAWITSFGFLSLLAYDYTKNYNLMYIGIIGIGSGWGIWWVIAPIIILDDIGSFSFNIVWGGVLTMNFLGLFFFTIIFAIIDIYFSQSLMFVLLIALFSCVLAAFIWIYSFIQEMKEKPLEINRGT